MPEYKAGENMRSILTITQVMTKRTGTGQRGAWEALDFFAVNPEGATLKYGVFNKPELFGYIIQGMDIDAEFTEKPSTSLNPEGQPIVNRNVQNIYIDGQPIIKAQQKKEWQPRQSNPDERRSIERQSSAKLVFNDFKFADTLQARLGQAEIIYQWISAGTLPQAITTTSDKSTPATPKPVEAIIPLAQTIEGLKTLHTKKIWKDVETKENLVKLGATGESFTDMLKSLEPKHYMAFSEQVHKAGTKRMVEAAKKLGAVEEPPPDDEPQ